MKKLESDDIFVIKYSAFFLLVAFVYLVGDIF